MKLKIKVIHKDFKNDNNKTTKKSAKKYQRLKKRKWLNGLKYREKQRIKKWLNNKEIIFKPWIKLRNHYSFYTLIIANHIKKSNTLFKTIKKSKSNVGQYMLSDTKRGK